MPKCNLVANNSICRAHIIIHEGCKGLGQKRKIKYYLKCASILSDLYTAVYCSLTGYQLTLRSEILEYVDI